MSNTLGFMNIISLFSGAGGLDVGFEKAGFKTIWTNEYNKEIWKTLQKNFPNALLDTRNICYIPSEEIPETLGVVGGPPSSSWLKVGKSAQTTDPKEQLFFEFIRIIRDKKPLFFIAETTANILSKKCSQSLQNIEYHCDTSGYRLSFELLNTSDYKVPQERKRVFFVGFRKDLNTTFHFPKGFKRKRVLHDVIEGLQENVLAVNSADQSHKEHCLLPNHEYLAGDFSAAFLSRNRVRSWDQASFTLPATAQQIPLHPQAPKMKRTAKNKRQFAAGKKELYRRLSVRECARIQTFPDSYIFYYNTINAGYKMVADAVPPNIAYILANKIRADLESSEIF